MFEGRLSKYPFSDHNVPPLPYMSLVTRDMRAWLSGLDISVAMLHSKGRSGTLACALSPCQISEVARIFKDGKRDGEKMVRKFATVSTGAAEVFGDRNMLLSDEGRVDMCSQDACHPQQGGTPLASSLDSLSYSVGHSLSSGTGCENKSGGIIVHANWGTLSIPD
ncbi:hypothetical protein F5141DRAFT_188626 [Pisolithus sp. B1]|nr:hypothetical protein F5141DRAFT_188626 [Pisolithus sp. B1]